MNRGTARTTVKAIWLGETGSYWSDAQLNSVISAANRRVFNLVIEQDPTYFQTVSGNLTYPANTENIDLSGASFLNGRPQKILAVEQLESDAAVGSGNQPTLCEPVHPSDIQRYYTYSTQTLTALTSYRYALLGDLLYLGPLPTSAVVLRVRYITPIADLAEDSTTLLGNQLVEWHELVTYIAAEMALAKAREPNDMLSRLRAETQAEMIASLTGRQIQEPRYIRDTFDG